MKNAKLKYREKRFLSSAAELKCRNEKPRNLRKIHKKKSVSFLSKSLKLICNSH